MSNKTMRIFFPLKIANYPQGQYGPGDNPEEITPAEVVKYEDAILTAIDRENRHLKYNHGLAEYIRDDGLKERCIVCIRQWRFMMVNCRV